MPGRRRDVAFGTSFGAAGLAISGKSGFDLIISRSCQILEFSGRGLFINVPTFLLASFPEINRICSVTTTYFLLQVVGICWAILLNAGFALACQVTHILPALRVDTNAGYMNVYSADLSNFSSGATAQLIASFYVAYASIRIMIAFGKNVFSIALQSTTDFPDASKQVVEGGASSLTITRMAFIPAIALQVGLIFADTMCIDVMGDSESVFRTPHTTMDSAYAYRIWSSALFLSRPARNKLCTHLGFNYFTSPYKNIRSLFFSVLLIMVLQIWQVYLQQFPRWNPVFTTMTRGARNVFQTAALILLLSTLGTLAAIITRYTTDAVKTEQIVLFNMLGWTAWLYFFTVHLVRARGELWSQTISAKHIQHMLAYLRISQMLILALMFMYKAWLHGLLQAQLDLTFITLLLPGLYTLVYLASNRLLRVQHDKRLLFTGLLCCFMLSIFITFGIAQTDAKGSAVLVFAHVVSKWIEFYDITEDSEEFDLDGEYTGSPLPKTPQRIRSDTSGKDKENKNAKKAQDTSFSTNQRTSVGGHGREDEGSKALLSPVSSYIDTRESISNKSLLRTSRSCHAFSESLDDALTPKKSSPEKLTEDGQAPRRVNSVNSLSILTYQNGYEHGAFTRQRAMSITTRYLKERGQVDNPLVSLGIPAHVRRHWLLKLPKRNMRFLGNLLSWAGMGGYSGNNAYAGTIRVFVNIAMMLILLLTTVTIAAWAQRSLQLYPKELINFKTDFMAAGSGVQGGETENLKAMAAHRYVHFDHKVSNVTLHFYPPTSTTRATPDLVSFDNADTASRGNAASEFELSIDEPKTFQYAAALESPYYMACSWKWKGLSVFDFALLSQVAYFDDDQYHITEEKADGNDSDGKETDSFPRKSRVQTIIDTLFPDDEFVATNSHPDHLGIGPRFVEVYSAKLNITVLAVRGTDVGRLQDIMEDFKLYAEPVIFTILSMAFPTIRFWNHETTARIIECLFEFNSFFGLQGEAEYYRPLAQRVLNIARSTRSVQDVQPDTSNCLDTNTCGSDHDKAKAKKEGQKHEQNPQHNLVITGHSLGGGLARIVGTLTGQASVSFGPPGLGLSYRKYSIEEDNSNGNLIKIHNKSQMDHQSLAIVTAFDLVTQIDQQVGLIQNIQCDHQDKAVHTSACHLLEGTICHLLKHCGDHKGRFMTCESQFEVGVLGPTVSAFLWNYRYLTGPLVLVIVTFFLLAVVPALV